MTDDVPVLEYHYPSDSQFSLDHVTADRERHEERLAALHDTDEYTIQTVEETINGTTSYLIYVNDAPDEPLPEFDTAAEYRQWLRERFDTDDLPIVLTVFRAYRGIIEEKDAAGNQLTLYKQIELEKIPEIVERVQWGQSVPDVGAELLSEFLLAHPMPNTNHRTGISLLDRYLTSLGSGFSMPETGEEGEWYPWVVDYIHDSKRLLTLRWRTGVFRYAAEVGYQTVRRKEGITIDLTSIDLERSDPFEYYATQHLERTQAFVENLLEKADATALRTRADDGKRAFVDRLRADQ